MRLTAALLLYFLVMLPAAQAFGEECPAQPETTATTVPNVRRGHDVRFNARLQAIEAALTTRQYDVLVLGDSIIQQWPQEMLDQVFPGRRVLNAGVVGDGSAALLHRLAGLRVPAVVDGQRSEIGVAGWERQRPAEVVVLIGTNDLRRAPPCDVALGGLAVADRLRLLYPAARIALVSILPRGASQTELAAEISVANRHLSRVASRSTALLFVNAHDALMCPAEAACAVARAPNYVHLTTAGYERLGAALRQALAGRQR